MTEKPQICTFERLQPANVDINHNFTARHSLLPYLLLASRLYTLKSTLKCPKTNLKTKQTKNLVTSFNLSITNKVQLLN